jgi:glycosyltransferase involved in cell wall biosynthesis
MPGALPVVLLVTTFARGGAEKTVAAWAAGLPRDKYAVDVVALQGRDGAMVPELRAAQVACWDLGMRGKSDFRILPRLACHLRRRRTRILVTFMFHPTILGRLVGRLLGIPIRVSSERIMEWDGPVRRWLNRWTVPLTTCVIAVSDRVAAYAQREYGIPPERLVTIVNGVDLERFRPPAERAPGAVIGCTGRLHRKNDHATLLRALARLRAGHPQASLLLVGDGPERRRLAALAESLGASDCVEFAGEQADVAPWLERMHIYAQPSVAEGMSNSVLEAMASGLPVVATAVGGTPELVVDGRTGYLVPPSDAAALAAALERLLASPEQRRQLGQASRERAERCFGLSLMLERVETLLDTLVERELSLRFTRDARWVPC